MKNNVNQRAQQVLRLLIERYIRDGQPVSSKTLAAEVQLSLSSATIRNIIADLEEQGYVKSLHTSSGRIPTTQGYRLFVNSILTVKSLDEVLYSEFKQELNPEQSIPNLVAQASTLLSRITKMAGIVTMPRVDAVTLTHVEFLPLSGNRVLVVLVLNEKEVENRIIQTEKHFTRRELEQAANYLNLTFAGKNLEKIRENLLTEMQQDRSDMDRIMQTTIDMATQAFTTKQEQKDYVLAGEHHLFGLAEETDINKLKQLFKAFNQKREILYLLDKSSAAEGVQIFIGDESGYEIFDNCSMVTAPYFAGNTIVGALGVIGPTRMPYEKVITMVDISAKLLSSALGKDKNLS